MLNRIDTTNTINNAKKLPSFTLKLCPMIIYGIAEPFIGKALCIKKLTSKNHFELIIMNTLRIFKWELFMCTGYISVCKLHQNSVKLLYQITDQHSTSKS